MGHFANNALGKLRGSGKAPALLVLLCVATAIALPAQTFTTLRSFDGADGNGPNGLTQATNGDLYGIARGGGANGNDGTIFKMTPSGRLTTLYSFCTHSGCTDGADRNYHFVGYIKKDSHAPIFKDSPCNFS